MTLDQVPIFRDLTPTEQTHLLDSAAQRACATGDVLFYEGDPARELCVLAEGTCTVSESGGDSNEVTAPALLDPVAALGDLPHAVKITARENCRLLCWSAADLRQVASFADAARAYLAGELQRAQSRLDELEAPVHYAGDRVELVPGPFMFENVTMIFAFCDADLDGVRSRLPGGVRLLRRPGRKHDSLMIALAKFPNAYPEHNPMARFAYTETTCFVPVRYRRSVGLFVPYIYPSTWEPILLGRELYGFPKRLGRTEFDTRSASLAVDGVEHFSLHWDGLEASDEPHLVGSLMSWLGIEGRTAALAFQAGDALRKAMQFPSHRRVEVFNHQQILSPDTSPDAPVYAVDRLTHAIFGVLRWYQIARMRDPVLTVKGGPFAGAHVTLRAAYRAQLDMRLSTGRVVRDYLNDPPE